MSKQQKQSTLQAFFGATSSQKRKTTTTTTTTSTQSQLNFSKKADSTNSNNPKDKIPKKEEGEKENADSNTTLTSTTTSNDSPLHKTQKNDASIQNQNQKKRPVLEDDDDDDDDEEETEWKDDDDDDDDEDAAKDVPTRNRNTAITKTTPKTQDPPPRQRRRRRIVDDEDDDDNNEEEEHPKERTGLVQSNRNAKEKEANDDNGNKNSFAATAPRQISPPRSEDHHDDEEETTTTKLKKDKKRVLEDQAASSPVDTKKKNDNNNTSTGETKNKTKAGTTIGTPNSASSPSRTSPQQSAQPKAKKTPISSMALFFQPKTTSTSRSKSTTAKASASATEKATSTTDKKESATKPDNEKESPTNETKTKAESSKEVTAVEETTNNTNETKEETDGFSSIPTSLYQAARKGQFSSDETLWKAIDTNQWPVDSPVPYVVLCQVFGQIEEITGRLQIQELLTKLFRQILLRRRRQRREEEKNENEAKQEEEKEPVTSTSGPKKKKNNKPQPHPPHDHRRDVYDIMYLASNEVAPAYQCVELGIGDAILIKAIGEATGTAPNMVKAKYESIGDLGTVAMTYKSKQKTLGGFFGTAAATAKGKSAASSSLLTAHTVLQVFREIAETKGNQSQKWKVEKIKKLLVKASVGMETKYIIRGLQGKLRIGLAQSTVLIALAHALALTQVVEEDLQKSTTTPNSGTKRKPSGNPKKRKTKKTKTKKTSKELDDTDSDEETEDEEEEEMEEDECEEDKALDGLPQEVKQYLNSSLPVEKRLEGAVNIIKKAYSEVPSYDSLLDAALSVPLEQLHQKCTLRPGIPVSPMLAKPTKSIQEVLKRLNGQWFTCEYKYDGERAQVHLLPDGTTKVFSRNLLDTSEKYPEVPRFVRDACAASTNPVRSFVMDAEVVAFNNKTGQLVPFQVLSTRKKTQESNELAKVQVIVQAFDLMYLNGESLLSKSLFERRQLLREHFVPVENKFQFAQALDHEENGDTTVIEEFLDQAVKGQCEGLMVKTLNDNAMYEPSRRSLNWLKLKKDYLEGLGDSVDLVPLGAYHGRGKRTGVYGAYLLGCYDVDSEEFQSVCKIGTGFSDEDLKNLAETLNQHVIPTKSSDYRVQDSMKCDVWFDAVQVWEVKAADLSQSSAHTGAVGKFTPTSGGNIKGERGIGLRFPRFERIREDKKPHDATTSDQILELYYNQDSLVAAGGDDDDDMDGL